MYTFSIFYENSAGRGVNGDSVELNMPPAVLYVQLAIYKLCIIALYYIFDL